MLKKWLIVAGLAAMFLPFGSGCNTTEPVMWSWPHHKRRVQTIADGFHEFHLAIDRIIFDMEEHPIEADF